MSQRLQGKGERKAETRTDHVWKEALGCWDVVSVDVL